MPVRRAHRDLFFFFLFVWDDVEESFYWFTFAVFMCSSIKNGTSLYRQELYIMHKYIVCINGDLL